MGLYYSGGYDWTFDIGPSRPRKITTRSSGERAYGKYANAQIHELIAKYIRRCCGTTSTGQDRQRA